MRVETSIVCKMLPLLFNQGLGLTQINLTCSCYVTKPIKNGISFAGLYIINKFFFMMHKLVFA